ncbi:19443_t:CDS:1 [Cetraspora pellucida]|uniref:19443_t:CDS:1 n=1 Tax=Cetraspora pellucida TaxID=1433469 RepID=A0A9N9E9T0_9GLOM|nr:19443_t:CDS:1 [Cetraspora pellucida]
MANVKVLYGSIIRRFTIPNDTTWSSFESQIRSLFQIPPQTPIFLSYTDEDGDIITLSSDLELQEILSDQSLFGSSVKFVLSTPDELVPNEKNSWVLEGSTSQIKEDGLPKFTNDSDVISFSSSDEDDCSEASPINMHESRKQSLNESQQPFMFQKNQDYRHATAVDKETEEPTFKPTIIGQQPETIGESSSSPIVDEELPKKEEKQPESDQPIDNNNNKEIESDQPIDNDQPINNDENESDQPINNNDENESDQPIDNNDEESIFRIHYGFPPINDNGEANIFRIYYGCHDCDARFNDNSFCNDYNSYDHRSFGTRRHCSAAVAFYKFTEFIFKFIDFVFSLATSFCKFINFLLLIFLVMITSTYFFTTYPLVKFLIIVFAFKYFFFRNNNSGRFRHGCRSGRCHERRSDMRNQCCQRRECDKNTNDVVAEKVKFLRDMGFEGENLEELIKLYNGNMEFAVETLLQRQQLYS